MHHLCCLCYVSNKNILTSCNICLTGLCKSVISAQEMKCVLLLNISIATYSHDLPLHTDKTVVQNISLSYYK